ncbi:MAG: ABC transporter permease, partial [Anaerolineaceae bacterium]|nr:ABC transporter permease [Anaerolineaceae bacterium]
MTQLTIRQFLKHRMAVIGFVVMLVITILVAGASIFQRYDPLQINLRNRFQPPSLEHFFGTDDLGRDMWARTLKGGQVSLMVGFLAMGVSIILGSVIGLVSGYFGGWTDSILSRITEIFQSVPRLFILIALTTFLRAMDIPWLRPGTFWPIAMVIGILAWMGVARLVRGSTLELREQEFIQAARMIGAS